MRDAGGCRRGTGTPLGMGGKVRFHSGCGVVGGVFWPCVFTVWARGFHITHGVVRGLMGEKWVDMRSLSVERGSQHQQEISMISFRSERVTMGSRDYHDAQALAQRHADSQGGRVP